jgi:leucyl/phenylalanyl-tRNA--protein transferase
MIAMTDSGHIFIGPDINTDALLDIIIELNYKEEFCVSRSFSYKFIAELMYSGFLVMSMANENMSTTNENKDKFILLPKHHLMRNVLFFDDLHIGKTVKRLIKRDAPEYDLFINRDYDEIIKRCAAHHGDDWLTKPLLKSINRIRHSEPPLVQPCSFGLYHNGVLCAGEFGVKVGAVYTSYSGYHEESSSGTIQMILLARYLQRNGFAFWDLGMPLDYKYTLGAHDIGIKEFVSIFRAGRQLSVNL